MVSESSLRRYRTWYAKLLCFYPKRFHDRFGEGMQQTFHDLCRERLATGNGLLSFVLWIFFETTLGIVKENVMSILANHRNIVRILLVTMLILMVPLVSMQFSNEVNWDAFDFFVAATLLIGSGLIFDFIARRSRDAGYKTGVGVAVVSGLILVWMNLAVGLIGSEDHPANLMYFVVLLIGFVGAILVRFTARGMARVMSITAMAQALVPVIALMIWQPPLSIGVVLVFALSTVFAVLFAGSAFLFYRSSAKSTEVQPSL